jgi:DNA-binding NtrC family response regulator
MAVDLALIMCTDRLSRDRVAQAVRRCGLAPLCCATLEEGRALLAQGDFKIVLSEEFLPDGDVFMAMREVKSQATRVPLIVLAKTSEWEDYLKALAAGVFDYIFCPPSVVESETVVRCALADLPETQSQAHFAA